MSLSNSMEKFVTDARQRANTLALEDHPTIHHTLICDLSADYDITRESEDRFPEWLEWVVSGVIAELHNK